MEGIDINDLPREQILELTEVYVCMYLVFKSTNV